VEHRLSRGHAGIGFDRGARAWAPVLHSFHRGGGPVAGAPGDRFIVPAADSDLERWLDADPDDNDLLVLERPPSA